MFEMKDAIMSALVLAAKRCKEESENLTKRVVGEKEDVVTKGDIELGTLITKILLISKRQILVESEETEPKDNLEEGTTEDYYVAIDDIDGTNNLRVGNGKLPYCSMIVAFDGSKKTEEGYKYSDYTHAACLDYMTGRIYYTEKGLGRVEEYDLNWHKMSDSTQNIQDNTNLALTLSTDVVSTRRGGSVGYAASTNVETEMLPGELDPVYKAYAITDSGCSVFEYAMVGMGIRNGYVSSGKKMHELPLLYAFAAETGKEMIDFEGKSYGDKTYHFKGKNAEVIAADKETAQKIRKMILRQRFVNSKLAEVYQERFAKKDMSIDIDDEEVK